MNVEMCKISSRECVKFTGRIINNICNEVQECIGDIFHGTKCWNDFITDIRTITLKSLSPMVFVFLLCSVSWTACLHPSSGGRELSLWSRRRGHLRWAVAERPRHRGGASTDELEPLKGFGGGGGDLSERPPEADSFWRTVQLFSFTHHLAKLEPPTL